VLNSIAVAGPRCRCARIPERWACAAQRPLPATAPLVAWCQDGRLPRRRSCEGAAWGAVPPRGDGVAAARRSCIRQQPRRTAAYHAGPRSALTAWGTDYRRARRSARLAAAARRGGGCRATGCAARSRDSLCACCAWRQRQAVTPAWESACAIATGASCNPVARCARASGTVSRCAALAPRLRRGAEAGRPRTGGQPVRAAVLHRAALLAQVPAPLLH
jgi:hypothetical protein